MAEEVPMDAINATFYKIQGENTKWLSTPGNSSDFSIPIRLFATGTTVFVESISTLALKIANYILIL